MADEVKEFLDRVQSREKEMRISENAGLPNHGPEADFLNQLILDLKKQILGYPHDKITMERLEEGTKHVFSLDKCRSPMRSY